MFKNKKDEKLDIGKINNSISLFNKILKIGFILIVVVGIYASTLILKEWGIFKFIGKILNVLSPFFIGFIIAWLFNPFVTWLQKKKVPTLFTVIYSAFLSQIILRFTIVIY